jgi:deoxyribodipyrimidine photo-lyase
MKGLVWFRNNLRLHDNEPLHIAANQCTELLLVYCIDPRWFAETPYGFTKTGPYKAQFLLESLQDLQHNLAQIGGELIVRVGEPEVILPELLAECKINALYYQHEVGTEEAAMEQAVVGYCNTIGIQTHVSYGATLYHVEDMPFPLQELPPIFTNFRKVVEKSSAVRALMPSPQTIKPIGGIVPTPLPTMESLGFEKPATIEKAALNFTGGETAALQRLQHYFWETDSLASYKETRNGLLGADYSSKFSPWLALGCISSRYIYWEVLRYEQERVKNESTYWLVFELLWRDYFHFVARRYGASLFQKGGIKQAKDTGKADADAFQAWRNGTTGVGFIDANMRELSQTGFMSNRGRQNVASYLVHQLGVDWRMGAAWFEHCLIDYDVASNYGNWNYVAGIGNDPRPNRYFNTATQVEKYDPKGHYVKHWLG